MAGESTTPATWPYCRRTAQSRERLFPHWSMEQPCINRRNLFFEGSGSKVVQAWLQCSKAEQSVVETMGFGCFTAETAPY